MKKINWKVHIPFTNYSLQSYTLHQSNDVMNSSIDDVIRKTKMTPLEPLI